MYGNKMVGKWAWNGRVNRLGKVLEMMSNSLKVIFLSLT